MQLPNKSGSGPAVPVTCTPMYMPKAALLPLHQRAYAQRGYEPKSRPPLVSGLDFRVFGLGSV